MSACDQWRHQRPPRVTSHQQSGIRQTALKAVNCVAEWAGVRGHRGSPVLVRRRAAAGSRRDFSAG